jgi:hemoglobin
MAETMLEKYGRGRLARIVSSFYGDVLQSPRLGHYFDEVSIAGLIEHQARFLAMVMGGPPAYSPHEIEEAHHRFHIIDDDFDEMLRLLETSLLRFEVDPEDVAQVISRYRQMQGSVINPSPRGVSDPAS